MSNWLQSLFNHNKAWIVPIASAAAYAAGTSLKDGRVNMTAVGAAALVTAATLVKSPVGSDGQPAPQNAGQQAVDALVTNLAADVAGGAPLGSQAVANAAKETMQQAVTGAVNPPGQ